MKSSFNDIYYETSSRRSENISVVSDAESSPGNPNYGLMVKNGEKNINKNFALFNLQREKNYVRLISKDKLQEEFYQNVRLLQELKPKTKK